MVPPKSNATETLGMLCLKNSNLSVLSFGIQRVVSIPPYLDFVSINELNETTFANWNYSEIQMHATL